MLDVPQSPTATGKLRAIGPLVDRLEELVARPVPMNGAAGFVAVLDAHEEKHAIARSLRSIVGGDSRLSAVVVDEEDE